jgi:hypothetical protein
LTTQCLTAILDVPIVQEAIIQHVSQANEPVKVTAKDISVPIGHSDPEVIQYAERSGWYYRSYSRETRRYTLKLIKDAETLEQALSTAYKALQEVIEDQRTDRPKRQRKTVETLTDANHEDLQRQIRTTHSIHVVVHSLNHVLFMV